MSMFTMQFGRSYNKNLAFEYFDIVHNKFKKGGIGGYTKSSVIKNVKQAFGITSLSNSFFDELNEQDKHAEIRMLLCFASSIQRNDYIKPALRADSRKGMSSCCVILSRTYNYF